MKTLQLTKASKKERFSSYCFDDSDDSHEGKTESLSFTWLPLTFRYLNTSVQPLILLNFFLPPRAGGLKTVLLNWYLTYLA